ncbi:hypothetical protein [Dyella sp. 2RAB6]|uniref:hypothetical protein n=1 Tax=Dyella sp. 2RAB6 TaxID=3232992 RepID=UPI003F90316A
MADHRIEQAFRALQEASNEAHKRDATAAFVGTVALARRLLAEVIEDDGHWVVIGGRRCGRNWLATIQLQAALYRFLRDRAGNELLEKLKGLPVADDFDNAIASEMTPQMFLEAVRG